MSLDDVYRICDEAYLHHTDGEQSLKLSCLDDTWELNPYSEEDPLANYVLSELGSRYTKHLDSIGKLEMAAGVLKEGIDVLEAMVAALKYRQCIATARSKRLEPDC